LERLLAEFFQSWIGDAARTRAAAAHKPKSDARDARLLLHLLVEKRAILHHGAKSAF
jgi:hypothetical protein